MFTRSIVLPIIFLGLGACGGGGAGGGGGDSGTTTSTNSQSPLFTDALTLDASQISTIPELQFNTFAEFNRYRNFPLIAPSAGAAIYAGSTMAKLGASDQNLGTGFDLTLDLTTGTGQGRAGFISMAGPGTVEGLVDLGSVLDINVTGISGSTITGTITGEFSDRQAFDNQFSEEFQVDASFDARVVDIGGGRPGLVGTITGAIYPESAAASTIDGVLTANDTLGF